MRAHGTGHLKQRGLRLKIERGVSVGYGTRRRESKNGWNLSLMACYIEKSQPPGTDAEQSWKGDQVMTWVKLRPEWRMIFLMCMSEAQVLTRCNGCGSTGMK